jgi:GDP-D-mannose 3', 5'-epimerase
MEIVVTGHEGFIGSHIVKRLKELGHDIILVKEDLRYCELPIADGFMHFASNMGGVGFFTDEQFNPIVDNALMDSRIIDHCRKNKMRLFYPSSAYAYPTTAMNLGIELDESLLAEPYEPDQMYGLEKLFITRLSEYADFDMRVGILHTIYGENQEFTGKRAKFMAQICYKFATENEIVVWGNGEQTRTFLYISDAVEMILEIFFAKDYFGSVNISSSDEVKIKDVVNILSKYTGKTNIKYDEDKPTGVLKRAVDMRKFNKHYKTRQQVSLEKGTKKLFDYVKSNRNSASLLSRKVW